MIYLWLSAIFFLLAVSPASAQFDKVLKGLGGNLPSVGGGMNDAKIGSGLQEALKVGTENAVAQTRRDGRFLDEQGNQDPYAEALAKHGKAVAYGRLWSAN